MNVLSLQMKTETSQTLRKINMATRKKKQTVIESAEVAEMMDVEPTIVKGSHLTVKTFADGRTELIWDDAALERDVREAVASVSIEKPKRKRKEKS